MSVKHLGKTGMMKNRKVNMSEEMNKMECEHEDNGVIGGVCDQGSSESGIEMGCGAEASYTFHPTQKKKKKKGKKIKPPFLVDGILVEEDQIQEIQKMNETVAEDSVVADIHTRQSVGTTEVGTSEKVYTRQSVRATEVGTSEKDTLKLKLWEFDPNCKKKRGKTRNIVYDKNDEIKSKSDCCVETGAASTNLGDSDSETMEELYSYNEVRKVALIGNKVNNFCCCKFGQRGCCHNMGFSQI